MGRSKIKGLLILFFSCYLIASCITSIAKSEDITTGNLLPNAGDGVDWGSTSTEQIKEEAKKMKKMEWVDPK